MELFDDDADGKLGRAELDRFFAMFNSDDNKLISWDEFSTHAMRLMRSKQEREVERDAERQHVPTREELKAECGKTVEKLRREARRESARADRVARELAADVDQPAKPKPRHASPPRGMGSTGRRPGFA